MASIGKIIILKQKNQVKLTKPKPTPKKQKQNKTKKLARKKKCIMQQRASRALCISQKLPEIFVKLEKH